MMHCALIVFLVLSASQDQERRGVAAQGSELVAGARVRVSTAEFDELSGRIATFDATQLQIELDEESRTISVPRAELTAIEISRGRRSRARGAWSKAKWGALIGAIPGAISLGVQHDQIGEDGASVGEAVALGVWTGGLFGGLIGAAIGAISPGEEWESISPTLQLSSLGSGRLAVSFAVTFGF